jgi:hypothetical protein
MSAKCFIAKWMQSTFHYLSIHLSMVLFSLLLKKHQLLILQSMGPFPIIQLFPQRNQPIKVDVWWLMSHSYAPSTCGYIKFHNAWLWRLVFHLQKMNRLNGIGITLHRTDLFQFTIPNLFFLSIWVHNNLKNA